MELIASRITIPANLPYIKPVTAYAIELARNIGFDEDEVRHIHLALEESLVNVMKYGYEENARETFDVVFEPQPAGIMIRIEEKGVPFNPDRLPEYQPHRPDLDVTGAGLGLHLIKSYMDETAFIRKGRKGQEIRLTKHIKNKRIDNLLPSEERNDLHERTGPPAKADPPGDYIIRRMHPDEAVEVSKCAYKCYGYSYEDYIYYPDQLTARNDDGSLYSLVAVTQANRIMGHAALKYPYTGASIAESGVAFIYPEYRRLGLFSEFNDHFIRHAKNSGLNGLYGRAVTSHIASQRMAARHGYKDCGLCLGALPIVDFLNMTPKTTNRESLLMSFLPLKSDDPRMIHTPPDYHSIVEGVFQSINVPIRFASGEDKSVQDADDRGHVETAINTSLNMAEIIIHNCGDHSSKEIQSRLKELCLKHIDVIHLVLNLEDSRTEAIILQSEALGFFFAGILPYGLAGRHALILQYLNNVMIDSDKIKLFNPEAYKILEFLKTRSPGHPELFGRQDTAS